MIECANCQWLMLCDEANVTCKRCGKAYEIIKRDGYYVVKALEPAKKQIAFVDVSSAYPSVLLLPESKRN